MKQMNWYIPKDLLTESIAIMRPHGRFGNEGLALWFGSEEGAYSKITHVISVSGPGFRTTPLYMSLSLRAMSVLTDLAEKLDAFLIGQIHSHPGQFLDLSDLDKEQGIRIPGYLSVVCPYYAQKDIAGFGDCGIHLFEERYYRRLPSDEIRRRLIVGNTNVTKVHCEVPA